MARLAHNILGGASVASLLLLTACGGGDTPTSAAPTSSGATVTSSSAPPNPNGVNLNVQRCLTQEVSPGVTVANLVVPDTVTINLAAPSGFPNGRRLTDPVIDLTLAAIFLDLTKHPVTALAAIPLNPAANDLPFRPAFPYLAAAQGTPPLSPTTGVNFNFRTDPASAYTRVDRMGMPAVATALISSSHKVEYNDANPSDDANFKFLSEITSTLTGLTNALSTDLRTAGLTLCATPN
jgi:hypothetical protein